MPDDPGKPDEAETPKDKADEDARPDGEPGNGGKPADGPTGPKKP
jgi:hypothetical protein